MGRSSLGLKSAEEAGSWHLELWLSLPSSCAGLPGLLQRLTLNLLEKSMDKGAWWVTAHGVAKSWTQLATSALPLQALQEMKALISR